MSTTAKPTTVECINPRSGRRMNIDKATYELLSKAICHTLKKEGAIAFTQLVEGVDAFLKQQKTSFDGSLSWYTITVQKDMEARGIIQASTEKGKKLLQLK